MKLLVIGDLHGRKPKLRYKSDVVIAPGDFCSDAIRKYIFQAIRQTKKGRTLDWKKIAGTKVEKMLAKVYKDGRKVLAQLNRDGRPVYVVPGNWEQGREGHYWKDLVKGLKNIKDCHLKRRPLGEYDIIGYGYASGPEYKSEYKKKMSTLSKLFKSAKKPVIFLTHNMPQGIMDKVRKKDSPAYGKHYGSIVVRDIIKKYKPILCIGGHMHEYYGKKVIGKTVVINAGFGADKNTEVTLNGKIKTKFH
ncbi:metallophosphoesterase [Candidatus Woesearchaeota archaeon]|nr:metallophosphoesterase [Candidatus Woesearchaeota archaeon]